MISCNKVFCTPKTKYSDVRGYNDILEESVRDILTRLEKLSDYSSNGSALIMSRILGMDVEIDLFKPLRESTYIELPQKIKATKGVIKVKNNDGKCFLYLILSNCHPQPIPLKYKNYLSDLNFDGIESPVKIESIIKIYVFEYNKSIYPIRLADNEEAINLLLLSNK